MSERNREAELEAALKIARQAEDTAWDQRDYHIRQTIAVEEERDAALAKVGELIDRTVQLEDVRDAALAQVRTLREALEEVVGANYGPGFDGKRVVNAKKLALDALARPPATGEGEAQ